MKNVFQFLSFFFFKALRMEDEVKPSLCVSSGMELKEHDLEAQLTYLVYKVGCLPSLRPAWIIKPSLSWCQRMSLCLPV